jgi:hypothetical protein
MLPGRDSIAHTPIALRDETLTITQVALMFATGLGVRGFAARAGTTKLSGTAAVGVRSRALAGAKTGISLRAQIGARARALPATTVKLQAFLRSAASARGRLVGTVPIFGRMSIQQKSRAGQIFHISLSGIAHVGASMRGTLIGKTTALVGTMTMRVGSAILPGISLYFTPSRILKSIVSIRSVSSSAVRSLASVVKRSVSS